MAAHQRPTKVSGRRRRDGVLRKATEEAPARSSPTAPVSDAAVLRGPDGCVLLERPNGEGQTFVTCDPPGVYNVRDALSACEAFAESVDESCSTTWFTCPGFADGIGDCLPDGGGLVWLFDDKGAGGVGPCSFCFTTVATW